MDFRAQIGSCSANNLTTGNVVHNRASSVKAGYGTWQAAAMATSFEITHPDTIFKHSQSTAAASHGGMAFSPAFASHQVFEGSVEFSTCDEMKKRLTQNLDQYQQAIDQEFPPDQTLHARTHAVFSAIVRRGYYQATSFINSITPFYKLLTAAGLTTAEAWGNKMLTYAMSIFETTHKARTLMSEGTTSTFLFGIMKATVMLDEYVKAEWIKHPAISATMVLASLQKDGKGKSAVAGIVAEHTTTLVQLTLIRLFEIDRSEESYKAVATL